MGRILPIRSRITTRMPDSTPSAQSMCGLPKEFFMNIQEAKEQIKNSIIAYLTRDSRGEYLIPTEKQRPIFLMGPPGIGKTAIMQQIAEELKIGMVAYSMTHHTRQSALGLPLIQHKTFQGMEYDVSVYTMSEILASVYETIERTGIRTGILFLDEINCVSETLAPVMLQFLQYKTFGSHRLPDGWIIVSAGNPPEYNRSVREFDMATWDRLKRIDVESDFEVWKQYAHQNGTHPSITAYLETKNEHFYHITNTAKGRAFVTARGWDDLSQMLYLYEMHGMNAGESLISQYIQHPAIARDFSVYYDLFNQYKRAYQIEEILNGTTPVSVREQASRAVFDEKYSLIGLITDAVMQEMHRNVQYHEVLGRIKSLYSKLSGQCTREFSNDIQLAEQVLQNVALEYRHAAEAHILSGSAKKVFSDVMEILQSDISIAKTASQYAVYDILRARFNARLEAHKADTQNVDSHLTNALTFCIHAFGKTGSELAMIASDLISDPQSSRFINRTLNAAYFQIDKQLLVSKQELRLNNLIESLEKLEESSIAQLSQAYTEHSGSPEDTEHGDTAE